jgi:hypothetical protein
LKLAVVLQVDSALKTQVTSGKADENDLYSFLPTPEKINNTQNIKEQRRKKTQ